MIRSPALGVAAWAAVVLLVDVWWLDRYRASAPPQYDEAGYMAIALRDFHAFQARGLGGLVSAYIHQVPQAPLVPLVTVAPYLLLGANVANSIVPQLLAVAGLALATYALACRIVSRGWAALASGVMIALPVVSDYSRTFHFAVPAAALFTGAAWALARSDGLRSRRWALVAGALLGCTVLARTMTIAYLPGIGAAALVMCLRKPDVRRRLGSLVLLMGVVVIVAGTWYAPNGNYRTVGTYLTGSGYGGEAARYGKAYSLATLDYWLKQARVTVTFELYAPLALVLLACVVAFVAFTRWKQVDARAAIARLVQSDVVIPLMIVVEGYLALTSSRNVGTAFSLPWLPSLTILCVACAARSSNRVARRALVAALIAVSLFDVVMKSDAVGGLASRTELRVPAFATVPVTDGNWVARMDVAADGYRLPPPSEPLPQVQREWVPFFEHEATSVRAAARHRHIDPRLLVGTGDILLSTTRFTLGAELGGVQLPAVGLIRGKRSGDFARQMDDPPITLLVTADPPPSGGAVDPDQVVRAARAAGFQRFRTGTAPDGRTVTWWWRS